MNLLYAADNNYAWLAGISILSFLCNNSGKHKIYILDDGISDENRKKLRRTVSGYGSDIFLLMSIGN